jgi:Leucine-rich repeat (LRR) protein
VETPIEFEPSIILFKFCFHLFLGPAGFAMGGSQSNLGIKVDLSNKGIRDLELETKQPRMLPTFPKLQHMNLSKNKIVSIPPNIVADLQKSPLVIEHLQTLNFSRNKLTNIPECLFLLGMIHFFLVPY